MIKLKAICCLLFLLPLTQSNPQSESSNFEDADKANDFSSSSLSINMEIGEFDLRHSIPGEPDVDYPIYSFAPKTSFNCEARHEGYYADMETRCQVFRICANTDLSGEGFAFLCPNGTLFSQRHFVCDWYRNVDCGESEDFYYRNEDIGQVSADQNEMMEVVKQMVEYPMKTISKALGQVSNKFPSSSAHFNAEKVSRGEIDIIRSSDKTNRNIENSSKVINSGAGNLNRKLVKEEKIIKTYPIYDQQPNRSQIANRGNKASNIDRNTGRLEHKGRASTVLPAKKEEAESYDLRQVVPTSRIYVNNLGELSTDAGTTFNTRTSFIVGQDDTNDAEEKPKKSLDDVVGDSEAYRNHIEIERKEKLRQGLPGSEKSHRVVSAKATIKSATGYTVSDIPVQEINNRRVKTGYASSPVISSNIQKTTGKLATHIATEDLDKSTNLNFAASLNAALVGYDLRKNEAPAEVPEFIRNYVEQKTSILKPNQITESVEIKSRQPYGKFINLADNVNSGLFDSNLFKSQSSAPAIESKIQSPREEIHRKPKLSGEDILSQPIQPSQLRQRVQSTFQGYTTSAPNDYRQGRQFQFLGAAFTTSGSLTTVLPSKSNYPNSGYLPPVSSRRPSGTQPTPTNSQRGTIRYNVNQSKASEAQTQTTEEIIDVRIGDDNDEGTTANIVQNNKVGNQIPNILLDINDVNAAAEIQSPKENYQDIHVKKRAENLLIKGVQQTIYENSNGEEILRNALGEDNIEESGNLPFMIHVPTEDDSDNDLNSLKLQEILAKDDVSNLLELSTIVKDLIKAENATSSKFVIRNENKNDSGNHLNTVNSSVTFNNSLANQLSTIIPIMNLNLSSDGVLKPNITLLNVTSTISSSTKNPSQIDSTTLNNVPLFTTLLDYNTEPITEINADLKKPFNIKARYANLIAARRKTAKPVVYSKKPYTFRSYPKTSATTTAKPSLLINQKRRPLNRFALKDQLSNKSGSLNVSTASSSNDDLTAIANTYGGYRANFNRIRNDTKLKTMFKERTRNYSPVRNKSTTKLPNTNFNSNSNSYISFGTNNSQTNTNTGLQNLQSPTYQVQTQRQSNRIISQTRFGQDVAKESTQQQFGNFNQQNKLNTKFQQPQQIFPQPPVLPKPSSTGTYTQIPGTNIRISKSKEEATYIFSNDPKIQAKQQEQANQHISQQQNGYVPLNEYISNTLVGEINSITVGSKNQQFPLQTPVNIQKQQVPLVKNPFLPFPNSILPTTTVAPSTIRYVQPQPPLFNGQFIGFNQQATSTEKPRYVQQQNQFGNIYNPPSTNSKPNNFYLTPTSATPKTIQFSFGQQNNIQSSFLQNAMQQEQHAHQILFNNQQPLFQGRTQINPQQQITEDPSLTPQYILDQIPIAQRRLDLAEDVKQEGTLYQGRSSYEVPLGSIGRLSGDLVKKRIR